MRKLLATLLAALYLGTSVGMVVNMHYCMGRLAAWSLGHDDSQTCGRCGMEKSAENENGCCKDEQRFLKNDDDQKAASSLIAPAPPEADGEKARTLRPCDQATPDLQANHPLRDMPPRWPGVRAYLRHRTLLI